MSRQRRQFHLAENASAFVPGSSTERGVVASPRAVFDAPDRAEADRQSDIAVKKYRAAALEPAGWREADVPGGLAVSALPTSHRRGLRTINMLGRLNEELKRRTTVSGPFPNGASLLRLVSAAAIEISDEWETGRKYPTMEPD